MVMCSINVHYWLSIMAHIYNPSYTGSRGRKIEVLDKSLRPYLKYTKSKRGGGTAQVTQHWTSKCKPQLQAPVPYKKS
jgi:hypothetical protein